MRCLRRLKHWLDRDLSRFISVFRLVCIAVIKKYRNTDIRIIRFVLIDGLVAVRDSVDRERHVVLRFLYRYAVCVDFESAEEPIPRRKQR